MNNVVEPPTVSILSPVDGAIIPKGTNVRIRVSASSPGGIKNVKIFINGEVKKTCTPSSAPTSFVCTYSWGKHVSPGSYTIGATVTDELARSRAAESITVIKQ